MYAYLPTDRPIYWQNIIQVVYNEPNVPSPSYFNQKREQKILAMFKLEIHRLLVMLRHILMHLQMQRDVYLDNIINLRQYTLRYTVAYSMLLRNVAFHWVKSEYMLIWYIVIWAQIKVSLLLLQLTWVLCSWLPLAVGATYYVFTVILKAAYSVTMNIFRKFLFSFLIICKSRIKLCFHNKNVQYSWKLHGKVNYLIK